ncbi:TetR/AcrR family transcriptional regulator [Persicobacter psychrovividus]|uniref:TetR family transcriptional regulator n=1 Tax=Persicobacter psychrovividus TaxID=387638 RepID=A0ABM7VFD3_9BACT|nr:TetR family transcriptional regulator [Persicobacter psychrovividus]
MGRNKGFDKAQVLEKAMEVFWTQGYHATSIQSLVDHLGVNRASLYATFDCKELLFQQAFELYQQQNVDQLPTILVKHEDVVEGFRSLFSMVIDDIITDPQHKGCFVVNVTTELSNADEVIRGLLQENASKVEAHFTTYIERGKQNGSVTSTVPAATLAHLILTYFNGLRVVGKTAEEAMPLRAGLEAFLGILRS